MHAPVGDRPEARLAPVEEHVRAENRHDLEGILRTFGRSARYHDEAWGDHFAGPDGVRAWYRSLLSAIPDLHVELAERHVTAQSVILEVWVRGTHQGALYGLPGTGRRVEFPAVAIYSFDEAGLIAGERIYYDRATPLGQAGLFQDPRKILGRIATVIRHPLTVTRALSRASLTRARRALGLEAGHGAPACQSRTGAEGTS